MKETAPAYSFDPRLLAHHEKGFAALREIFEGDAVGPLVLCGRCACSPVDHYADPEGAMAADLALAAELSAGPFPEDQFTPLLVENDLFGVHMVDKIFGAEVFFYHDQWYTKHLQTEVGQLQKPDLASSEPVQLLRRYAQAYLDAAPEGGPLFVLPIIASPLNIAVNLYGEEILVAMLAEPEAAHHDLQVINQVLMELHQWYLDRFPLEQMQPTVAGGRTQPPGYGQICGCTTQLLSAQLYEEFILPLDDALLAVYPHGGMIHLCGDHRQLIDSFAKMPHLRSVQLNDRAAEHLEYYVKGLREDQVIYMCPFDGMPLEKTLEIAKGKKLVLVGDYHL